MTQQNMISINIPQNDLTEINKAVATLKTKLLPVLKSLQPEERMELPKMGDKTVAFVTKALEYCAANPDLVPQYLDVTEFSSDIKTIDTLRSIHAPLEQMTKLLSDTMIMAGSDAYSAALMFYNSTKYAKKSNVPKAGTIYDDLSSRFPGRKIQKEAKQE